LLSIFTILASGFESTHLWYEDQADSKRRRKEREQGRQSVGGIDLLLDHERRWNSDQTQHHHVVHTDTWNI